MLYQVQIRIHILLLYNHSNNNSNSNNSSNINSNNYYNNKNNQMMINHIYYLRDKTFTVTTFTLINNLSILIVSLHLLKYNIKHS